MTGLNLTTNKELILLALEELKNASYSVERREECERLKAEVEKHGVYIGNQVDACGVDPYELNA